MKAVDLIIKAKVKLMEKQPFFSYLILNLNEGAEIPQNMRMPTANINYKGEMTYNPEWIDSFKAKYQNQELEKVEGVLGHEVLHISLGHVFRIGNRVLEIYNVACDIVVNNMLQANGFSLLPGSEGYIEPHDNQIELYDGKIVIKDIDKKFVESVYDELYKQYKDNDMIKEVMVSGYGIPGKGKGKKGIGNGPKSMDSHEYGKGAGSSAKEKRAEEALAEKWAERMVSAANHAKAQGKLPAGMSRIIDKLLNKKLNWRSLLYRYITNSIQFDVSWQKFSKRSIATKCWMPGPLKENIDVVYAIDTSGSISQEELSSFLSEMVSLGKSFANIEITALFCDAALHQKYVVRNGNIPSILSERITGGGGTSHKPIMDFINKEKPHSKCLICLTDGYSDLEQVYKLLPRSCDLIICLSENGCDPKDLKGCGRVVKMED